MNAPAGEWKPYSGMLPNVLAGLGATPTQFAGRWWARTEEGSVVRYERQVGMGAADYTDPQTQADATAMNNALIAHGYKKSDMGLYEAFQADAGLTADGYPGTNTMNELQAVLFAMGVEIAPVPIYPWAVGAYDGVNAPLASQWDPSAPASAPPTITNTDLTTNNTSNWWGLPTWAVWAIALTAAGGVTLLAWSLMSKPGAKHLRAHAHKHHAHAREHLSSARKAFHAAEMAAAEERGPAARRKRARRTRRTRR